MKENASNQENMERVEHAFRQLAEINPVDAPPFLLTRIKQQIANKEVKVKPVWAVSFATAIALLFMLNLNIVSQKSEQTQEQNFISSMGLYNQNNLYP